MTRAHDQGHDDEHKDGHGHGHHGGSCLQLIGKVFLYVGGTIGILIVIGLILGQKEFLDWKAEYIPCMIQRTREAEEARSNAATIVSSEAVKNKALKKQLEQAKAKLKQGRVNK